MCLNKGLLIENDFVRIDIIIFSLKETCSKPQLSSGSVYLLLFIVVGDGLYSHREDKNQILRSEDRSSSVFKMMHLASLSSCKGGLRPNILAAMTVSIFPRLFHGWGKEGAGDRWTNGCSICSNVLVWVIRCQQRWLTVCSIKVWINWDLLLFSVFLYLTLWWFC